MDWPDFLTPEERNALEAWSTRAAIAGMGNAKDAVIHLLHREHAKDLHKFADKAKQIIKDAKRNE